MWRKILKIAAGVALGNLVTKPAVLNLPGFLLHLLVTWRKRYWHLRNYTYFYSDRKFLTTSKSDNILILCHGRKLGIPILQNERNNIFPVQDYNVITVDWDITTQPHICYDVNDIFLYKSWCSGFFKYIILFNCECHTHSINCNKELAPQFHRLLREDGTLLIGDSSNFVLNGFVNKEEPLKVTFDKGNEYGSYKAYIEGWSLFPTGRSIPLQQYRKGIPPREWEEREKKEEVTIPEPTTEGVTKIPISSCFNLNIGIDTTTLEENKDCSVSLDLYTENGEKFVLTEDKGEFLLRGNDIFEHKGENLLAGRRIDPSELGETLLIPKETLPEVKEETNLKENLPSLGETLTETTSLRSLTELKETLPELRETSPKLRKDTVTFSDLRRDTNPMEHSQNLEHSFLDVVDGHDPMSFLCNIHDQIGSYIEYEKRGDCAYIN
jgi:hypothetical protein